MRLPRNEKGFTLIEMLLGLFLVCMIAGLITSGTAVLNRDFQTKGSVDQMEWEIFLQQVKRDVRGSFSQEAGPAGIKLRTKHATILIERYQDKIRRRVDGEGHEILLQNIAAFSAAEKQGRILISVGDKKGNKLDAVVHLLAKGKGP
ncbi:competence type IV pilus minor pilin ComGF [Peribacillus kribbensis]|uniref:competence type IV pilus minor pilin ComGF n=1 Tax=Peribacillus kribbensis TaxID=356658 RepID=UPI0004193F00|nr:competence type IV pilus minor pilin ComGF [Peribacillus kribbensis]